MRISALQVEAHSIVGRDGTGRRSSGQYVPAGRRRAGTLEDHVRWAGTVSRYGGQTDRVARVAEQIDRADEQRVARQLNAQQRRRTTRLVRCTQSQATNVRCSTVKDNEQLRVYKILYLLDF